MSELEVQTKMVKRMKLTVPQPPGAMRNLVFSDTENDLEEMAVMSGGNQEELSKTIEEKNK